MDFLYMLQGIRNPVLDAVMTFFTYLGDELLIIGLLCIIYWCFDKKLAYKMCFTYFVSGLMVQGLKIACRIDRPWIRDSRLTCVESAKSGATGYSFPSGHSQSATALFSSLAFHFKKKAGYIIGFVLTALVMFSRMYLGCHTPQDVLTGFTITLAVSIIISCVFDKITSGTKAKNIIFVLIEAISLALIIFCNCIVSHGKADVSLAMDGFKAAGAGIGFGIGWFVENSFIDYNPKATKKVPGQILKFVIGIAVALVLKQGIKMIFGDTITVNIIRYAIVVIWVIAIYPAIMKKIIKS